MKKHYVLFFLALIAAFIPAAADTYVVDIDDVSRVELDIDGTPVTGLKNGSNSIDMGSAKYLRVTAKRGCVVIKVYGAASDFRALRSRYFSGDRFFWIFPKYRILKP